MLWDIHWSGSGFSRDHARAFLPFSGPQGGDLRRAARASGTCHAGLTRESAHRQTA